MSRLVWRQGPQPDVLVRAAHLLDPRSGLDAKLDLLIREGEIAAMGESGTLEAPHGAEVIDGDGRHLFPAFFDPHVHLRTPGFEHKEDLQTGTRSAAAGGFAAIVAMPNTQPTVDSAPILRSLRDDARATASVPVGFLAAISRNLKGQELTEMAELRDEGALGFTDDGMPVADAGLLRRAFQYQRMCGGVLALHEEDLALSAGGSMNEGEVSTRLGLGGIPSIAESTFIERDASIARYEEGRMHVQHVTCAEAVEAVATAKSRGTQITAEASPHHLLLTEDAIASSLDTRLKMNPPLRTEADRLAVVEALRTGVLDCIGTDHAPHSREEKEVPFEEAMMGTTGLETAFAAVYTDLVIPGSLELDLLIERLTAGASVFDLPISKIAQGERANLCLIDLGARWTVGEAGYESRSDNCCFAGRTLNGKVLLTIADGSIAYRERSLALSAA